MGFRPQHGMEEVIGSIPIRSTKYLNNLADYSPTACPPIAESSRATALEPSLPEPFFASSAELRALRSPIQQTWLDE
jgi:hypothetical protein